MRKFYLVPILLFNAINLFSQEPKDTLFFANGSMVIGEVKKIKLGVISFDPDDANDITVQLRNLKSLSAPNRIFRIETIHDVVYFGRLAKHYNSKYVFALRQQDTVLLHLEDISNLYPFEKAVWQRFSGSVGLGYSYTRSSKLGRFNFDGTLRYVTNKSELLLFASGIYTITDSVFSRDREDVQIKYNYYLSTSWFATAFLAYQRNLELGLARRFQEGLGVGNKFITSKSVYAWARGGIVANQEKNTEGIESGTLWEIFGQIQFNFFRFSKPEIDLSMSQTFFYSLSQSGRFRNDGSTNLDWEIIDDLKLSLEFYNNLDTKPPGAEGKKVDYGVVFGISYSF
jgi:Protein of unknown function, DUF481